VQESEGGRVALRFSSIRVREGGHRRHVTRRRGQMGGGGLGTLRKEKRPWVGRCWAKMGHADRVAAGSVLVKTKENGVGCFKDFGPNRKWAAELISRI
jgi:hypothetical protein